MQILVQATLLPHGQKAWKPVTWKIGRIKNIELASTEKQNLAAITSSLGGSLHPPVPPTPPRHYSPVKFLPSSLLSQQRGQGKAVYELKQQADVNLTIHQGTFVLDLESHGSSEPPQKSQP